MSKAIVAVGFDYGELSKDSKGRLLYLAGQIRKQTKSHIENVLALGELIQQAHAELSGGGRDGEFGPWVEAECGFSRKTAYNYLHAYERFNKCESLSHFSAEAVYALAAPDVPDKAIKEAVRLADKGERVNASKAKEILDKFREATTRASGKPGQTSKTTATQTEAAKPSGPCPHGGEHEYDDEACKRCHDPKPGVSVEPEESSDAGKLFAKIFEHLGKVTRLLDDLKKAVPNSKYFDDVFASLECANQDLHKWRRAKK
jgi:hypothetical protein